MLKGAGQTLHYYTIPLDVNSNGQCSPRNYVLSVHIFINKYRIVGNALNK